VQTIDNDIYDRIPNSWWDDDNFMALLRNAINPPRFLYFKEALVQRLAISPTNLKVLDVGCGGGLLAEEFAKLGCDVTGIDRSLPTLATARAHAKSHGLSIRYLPGNANSLPFDTGTFDVVYCCDVLEHVEDVSAVIAEISRVLKRGGVFFFDTINRTLLSKVVAIKAAQEWKLTRFVPRNVHVWDKFIRPAELAAILCKNSLQNSEFAGLSPRGNPLSILTAFLKLKFGRLNFAQFGNAITLAKSRDTSISYMGFAVRL
jgi:2-polyprenyl-6-hydroxyphenyl methylase/3-demethylubiquinone-9 3-methyltransferase